MGEAVGKQLASEWDDLSANAKLAIMRELVTIEAKLLCIIFTVRIHLFHCADVDAIFSFGDIYFASDAVKGAVPAEIISDIPQELKEKAAGIFTIGP